MGCVLPVPLWRDRDSRATVVSEAGEPDGRDAGARESDAGKNSSPDEFFSSQTVTVGAGVAISCGGAECAGEKDEARPHGHDRAGDSRDKPDHTRSVAGRYHADIHIAAEFERSFVLSDIAPQQANGLQPIAARRQGSNASIIALPDRLAHARIAPARIAKDSELKMGHVVVDLDRHRASRIAGDG